jgi:hypothetical protein
MTSDEILHGPDRSKRVNDWDRSKPRDPLLEEEIIETSFALVFMMSFSRSDLVPLLCIPSLLYLRADPASLPQNRAVLFLDYSPLKPFCISI